MLLAITDQPIDVAATVRAVEHPEAGAVVSFVGTVRDHSGGRQVVRLDFEAYDAMALRQLEYLAAEARTRWPMLRDVAVVHRKGSLAIGDVAVVVAVSTPHRADAFAACQFLIDTLKEVLPIWKHEHYADGSVWVAAHP